MSMQPNAKRVFVLEDQPNQLETYVRLLKRRGFEVVGAKNREDVEQVLKSDESFDLLLLDMNLKDDPGLLELNLYGSDIGELLVTKQAAWPPEVLVMTAYSTRVDFWRKAFAVGATVFLEKRELSLEETINYVCIMLLRRAVSLRNPRCNEVIGEVLNRGGRERRVLEEFFQRLVVPEFDACLGLPFIMVLEYANASADEAPAPPPLAAEATLSEQLAELVVKASYYVQVHDVKEPFRLDEEVFQPAPLLAPNSASDVFFSTRLAELLRAEEQSDAAVALTELLEDAAFIPLQLTPDVRLSLLLVKEKTHLETFEELYPLSLAKLMVKHSLDSLRMTLTNLIERLKNEQKIKQMQLQELARFCEYVGAETKRITFGVEAERFVPEENTSFQRLNLLADELSEAGEFLNNLSQENSYPSRRLMLRQVVQQAWDGLAQGGPGPSVALSFHGDCQATVLAAEEELHFFFSRLLHWLVSFYEGDFDVTPQVSVACRLEGSQIEIALESESVRLHKILRDSLFVPMTQRIDYDQVWEGKGPKLLFSLYLAKSLLERRYQGSLADSSDELPGELGHKLVIRMPVLNE